MTTLILTTGAALASPGMAGALHLGAEPVAPGSAWAGAGGFAAWDVEGGWGAGLVEAGASFGDRAAIDLQAATDLAYAGAFPVVLAARYLVVDRDDLRVAATFTSFVLPVRDEHVFSDFQVYSAHSPGIALDAGGRVVRFDLAVPVWGITSYDAYFGLARFPFPLGGTIGADFLVSDRSRIRIGVPELLSYGWRSERAYVDVGGVTILAAGAVWTKLGVVF